MSSWSAGRAIRSPDREPARVSVDLSRTFFCRFELRFLRFQSGLHVVAAHSALTILLEHLALRLPVDISPVGVINSLTRMCGYRTS